MGLKRILVRRPLLHLVFAALGAASLSGHAVVPDAGKIEPLARPADEPAVIAAQRSVTGTAGRPGDSIPVFIRLADEDPDLPEKVRNLGGDATKVAPRIYAASIPRDATRYLSNWPRVAYIEAAKKARPLLDASRPATGADVVQSGGSGLPGPYDGTGSFVGIVDTGLSRNHSDFFVGGDPARPRTAYWFPDNATAGVDNEWHGTHVAGIAAGNGFSSGGLYTGMAPGARLLIARTTFYTTDILLKMDSIFAAAGASPVALNLSLGTVYGPHDGTSAFEQSVNAKAQGTAGSKRIVAVAAGNERTDREHYRRVLSAFETVSIPVAIPFTGIPYGSTVDIWADGADRYTVTASIPGGATSVASDQPPNGATHFQVFFTAAYAATGSIVLQRTRNAGSGKVDAYVDAWYGQFDPSVAVESGSTIEPANGDSVLAVGSFNTKLGTSNYGTVGSISTFSSLGPTRDGRRKPDVAAPGAYIYSAKSRDAYDILNNGTPPPVVPGNDNYAIMAGTSMAAPHVTGIAALVWHSNPSLTGAQMRARLKDAAVLPAGVPAPDSTWGYGKVSALRAVSRTVASITAPATATPGTPVSLTSENSSAAFDAYALSYAWTLAQMPAGSRAALASANAASTSFTPDLPGDYTVALTASQSAPAAVPAGTGNVVIRVNNVPTAVVTGPAGTDNATPIPATFSGATSSDPDGQPLTFHWVLVSRPTGSHVTALSPAGTDNATLTPDVRGVYEIGLRADDGLDNSALAVFAFRSGPAPWSGGSSGSCSVAPHGAADAGAAAGTALFAIIALAGARALTRRKRGSRP